MLAGLVTVDENNFLYPYFGTSVNRILNDGFAVKSQKPLCKALVEGRFRVDNPATGKMQTSGFLFMS